MLSFSKTCKLDWGPLYEGILCVTMDKYTLVWLFRVQSISKSGPFCCPIDLKISFWHVFCLQMTCTMQNTSIFGDQQRGHEERRVWIPQDWR